MRIRFFGTPVRIGFSAFFLVWVFGLLGWNAIEGQTVRTEVRYVFVVATVLFSLFSLLLHEKGHILTAQRYHASCSHISVFALGALAHLAHVGRRPRELFFIAAAGPLASGILAGVCYVLLLIPFPHTFQVLLSLLLTINILIGAFNLLPIFPLDGGRILHAMLWAVCRDEARGRIVAARISQACMIGIVSFLIFAYFQHWIGLAELFWYAIFAALIFLVASLATKQKL